jgi:hypothetical protein
MPQIVHNWGVVLGNHLIVEQMEYDHDALGALATDCIAKLNQDQKAGFEQITSAIIRADTLPSWARWYWEDIPVQHPLLSPSLPEEDCALLCLLRDCCYPVTRLSDCSPSLQNPHPLP